MRWFAQVVGTANTDTTPSIVLHFDSQRYLFNCGEGTQRLFVENGVRANKITNVFLTRMILTLADAGVRNLHFHGGPNLTHLWRPIVILSGLSVNVNEYPLEDDVFFEDENMSVRAVELLPISDTAFTDNDDSVATDASDATPSNEGAILLKRQFIVLYPIKLVAAEQIVALRKQFGRRMPRTRPTQSALCFIGQGREVQETKLKGGEAVTAPDGRVIQPHQVVGPSHPGAIFAVIDCPSIDYVDALMASEELAALQTTKESAAPRCMFHLLGEGVIEHPEFQAWLGKFSSKTQHIILSKECTPAITQFRKSAECQLRLNRLDSTIFPLSYATNQPQTVFKKLPNASVGETGLIYMMEPKPCFDRSQVPSETDYSWSGSVGQGIKERVDFTTAINEAHKTLAEVGKDISDVKQPGEDIVVVTLGTGSALPSKCRNVSATLLQIPDVGNILLDAGEGTLGQLRRHFDTDTTGTVTNVFVSHLHADHHLGIIRVLLQWQQMDQLALGDAANQHPLYIVGPWRFWTWLQEYNGIEPLSLSNIRFIGAPDLHYTLPTTTWSESIQKMLASLCLTAIRTTDVIHCPMAYGISIEHESGWKIVYSGDTRPCNKLVDMGQDATLLIHEATLEDTMQQEAIDKKHSTTSEAVDIGQRMNAYSILLTHFSQRYPRIPPLNYIPPRTGFAFDMMRVAIRDLWKMPVMLPAVRALFPDNDKSLAEEEEEGAKKKETAKLRKK
ncbi:beta-lactamase-like protein [Syncephalis fuscata]|nr:beta-lactamase-like protein [Syncephalis fuscata]